MEVVLKKATLFLLPFVISPLLVRSQEPFWQPSSGPYGGTVHSIAQDKDGRLYAGTLSIFRSDDHGESWKKLPFYHHADPVRALLVDDSNYVYANYGGSVARSTDHGETWVYPFRPDNGPGPNDVYAIAFNTRGELFVGNKGDPPSQRTAMYRFIRDPFWGAYWQGILNVASPNTIREILVKPTGEMFATGGRYLCRSLDNGDSWEYVGDSVSNYWSASVSATPGGTLLLGSGKTLFRSTNNGNRWSTLASDLEMQSTISDIVTISESELFISTFQEGIYYSGDTGENWETKNDGLDDLQVTALQIDKVTGYLYAGTRIQGIFRSTDQGNSWHLANNGIRVLSLSENISITSNDQIFVATQGSGVFRSIDSGRTWTSINNGLPVSSLRSTFYQVHESTNGHLFLRSSFYEPNSFGSDSWDPFRSTDGGNTWQRIYLPPMWFPNAIAFTLQEKMLMAVAPDYTLNESIDEGKTWQTLGLIDHIISSLLILPSGKYLAGSYSGKHGGNGGVFRSLDSGRTWEASGGWHLFGNELLKDVYGNLFSANGLLGVMKSTDDGYTWDTTNTGLGENTFISSITTNKQGDIFVCDFYHDSGGVFRSTNSGASWEAVNEGLLTRDIYRLGVDSLGYLYGISQTQGLYRTVQSTLTEIESEHQQIFRHFSLSQNYPNPFNPTTKFEVRIAKYEFVTVRIWNLLGEEVATLVNEMKQPGTYTINWDGSKYPSGVYFSTMTAGSFRETKKLLLVR